MANTDSDCSLSTPKTPAKVLARLINYHVHVNIRNIRKLFNTSWTGLFKRKRNDLLLTCWAVLNGVELEMPWVP